jgi:transglutaminase-like putative cysteine protease
MKKILKIFVIIAFVSIIGFSLAACDAFFDWLLNDDDNNSIDTDTPGSPVAGDAVIYNFNNGSFNGWAASATDQSPLPVIVNEGGERGHVVSFDARNTRNGGRVSIAKTFSLKEPTELRFLIFTDIVRARETALVVYINDRQIASYNGLNNGSWVLESFILAAGQQTIRFTLEKDSGTFSSSGTNTVRLDDITLRPALAASTFIEGFEYMNNAAWHISPWYGSAAITTAAAEAPNDQHFGNATRFVKLPAVRISGGGRTILERRINLTQASALTFNFKTEIHAPFGQNFRVLVNGVERGSWDGLRMSWRTETILLNAGEQIITFEVSSTGTSVRDGLNAVYIDNVSLVPDITDSVILYPRGNLNTYVGAPENERIRFRAEALRSDGSLRRNAAGFTFTGSGVNSSGVFAPVTVGTTTVSVSIDGKSASRNVTVHPANFIRLPYTYPGTGRTYQGFTGGTEGTHTTSGGVTITYPSQTRFSADGFFAIEGIVNNSAVQNHAFVQVTKNNDSSLVTNYYVKDNFRQRIWLRFGPGEYTVTVQGISNLTINSEGHISSVSRLGSGITFNVTNTHNSGRSVDGIVPDRRFIYPSYIVQSDDFRITNLVADLTYGLTDDVAKIKALHDYIVTNTVYDRISYEIPGMRKRQDALTVLGTRFRYDSQYPDGHFLAVCEGYTNAFAALARAAGFETKYISSTEMNHAWNHIFVNGAWRFMDVTWNDPSVAGASATNVVDGGPDSVRYDYFLLNSFTGVNNSHPVGTQNNGRSLVLSPPWQRGVPDGWY